MSCYIDKNNIFDCTAVVNETLKPEMVLINKDDFDLYTVTTDGTTGQITAITPGQGDALGVLYTFPKNSSILPASKLRPNERGVDGFEHSIDGIAFDISQKNREDLSKARFARVVAIVTRASGVKELLGMGVGLTLTELAYNPGTAEGSGNMSFMLTTPPGPGEFMPPQEVAASVDLDNLYTLA